MCGGAVASSRGGDEPSVRFSTEGGTFDGGPLRGLLGEPLRGLLGGPLRGLLGGPLRGLLGGGLGGPLEGWLGGLLGHNRFKGALCGLGSTWPPASPPSLVTNTLTLGELPADIT